MSAGDLTSPFPITGMETAPLIRPTERELRERDLAGLTRRILEAMEELILRHPGQYLWLHDRYKTRPADE